MASWMNEWEVEGNAVRFGEGTPNLQKGAQVLLNLMRWTNAHSDGWPYWAKPSRAAVRLTELFYAARTQERMTGEATDIPDAELKKALTPIKSFLTRQGVNHSEVFGA